MPGAAFRVPTANPWPQRQCAAPAPPPDGDLPKISGERVSPAPVVSTTGTGKRRLQSHIPVLIICAAAAQRSAPRRRRNFCAQSVQHLFRGPCCRFEPAPSPRLVDKEQVYLIHRIGRQPVRMATTLKATVMSFSLPCGWLRTEEVSFCSSNTRLPSHSASARFYLMIGADFLIGTTVHRMQFCPAPAESPRDRWHPCSFHQMQSTPFSAIKSEPTAVPSLPWPQMRHPCTGAPMRWTDSTLFRRRFAVGLGRNGLLPLLQKCSTWIYSVQIHPGPQIQKSSFALFRLSALSNLRYKWAANLCQSGVDPL